MNFENYITMFHIESMNIIIMITGSIVGVAYLTELFVAMVLRLEYENMLSRTVCWVHTGGLTGQ
jgi:molybdopterin-containing oxidoreductase family membrane subunit